MFCMWGYRGCEHISMENEGYWAPSSWSEYPVPHFCTVLGVVTLLWDPTPFWEFCSGTGHRPPSFGYCLLVRQLHLSQVLKELSSSLSFCQTCFVCLTNPFFLQAAAFGAEAKKSLGLCFPSAPHSPLTQDIQEALACCLE